VLFNAAGIVHAGTVLEASEAHWELAFDLNARAMVRTIHALLPGMPAGGGSIGNIASVAGSVLGVPNRFVCGASKAALGALDPATLPLVAEPARVAPPRSGCGKFQCIGLNHTDHAAESGLPVPKESILFMKPTGLRVGANDSVASRRRPTGVCAWARSRCRCAGRHDGAR